MIETAITVPLPVGTFQQLENAAHQLKRSVPDVVRELVVREMGEWPALPPDVEAELAAFANLSDEVLWLLARSTLTKAQQLEVATLNDQAQRGPLTQKEHIRQLKLMDAYDRMLVRRAQAAALLKSRGYDLSDPSILQVS